MKARSVLQQQQQQRQQTVHIKTQAHMHILDKVLTLAITVDLVHLCMIEGSRILV